MVDAVYAWMKQIVYFLLLVGIIRNLTGKKYEKYAKLTVGLCLVLMLAAPALKLLSGEEFRFLWQKNELEQELKLLESLPAGTDRKWEDGVIAEYEELIRRQSDELIAGMGMRAEAVKLEREGSVVVGFTLWASPVKNAVSWDSGGAGEEQPAGKISITDIVVRLGYTEDETDTAGRDAADTGDGKNAGSREETGIGADAGNRGGSQSSISGPDSRTAAGEGYGRNGSRMVYELAIKKRLADFYNMDEAHIHVIIQ